MRHAPCAPWRPLAAALCVGLLLGAACGYDTTPGQEPLLLADAGADTPANGDAGGDAGAPGADDAGPADAGPGEGGGADGGAGGGADAGPTCTGPAACDDRNPCTLDACEASGTCTNTATTGTCSVGPQLGCCKQAVCCTGPTCGC